MENIDYIFIIYTCKKNLAKANTMYHRYLNNMYIMNQFKIKTFIMYGDDTIDGEHTIIDDKYLVLNVDDGYGSLHFKTLKMCKTIYSLYPKIKGLFKCDDDIIININSIEFLIQSLRKFTINYYGHSCIVHEKENNSNHLIETGKSVTINEKINTPASVYCGGPFYYLSGNSLQIINDVEEDMVKDIFYEDLMIGNILNMKSIYPIHSNLYCDDIKLFNNRNSSYHNTDKKNTLFLKIQGGLGNQMFQIASGYGIALKNNMNFIIINSSVHKQNFTHIDDNNYLLDTIFAKFQRIDIRNINLQGIKYIKEEEQNCFAYNDIVINDDVFLDGYFQNEKYFINQKEVIQSLFKPNNIFNQFIHIINQNIQLVELLQTSYFIHVRRGDYLNHLNLYGIDYDNYYKLALSHITQNDSSAHFFILSDDIEYCKTYSVFQDIQRSYIELPALETIYFMSLCFKGGICCNSSFSWWGSYLNKNPQKCVTFPSKWINKDWKNDIYYKGSTIIDI